MLPAAVALALWSAVPAHPDPLVRRCLLAYHAAGGAYQRVACEGQVVHIGRDARVEGATDFDELCDGDREVRTEYRTSRTRPADEVLATAPAYSFRLERAGDGWAVRAVTGERYAGHPTAGRRPFDAGPLLARPLAELSARRVVWRGEPVTELVFDVADPPPAAGDDSRSIGGLLLRLDGPETVAGRRVYHRTAPDRLDSEEVFTYKPNDGPRPALAAIEFWATDPAAGDAPWVAGRTSFRRFDRLTGPADPARFTLTGYGLPEPTDLPHPEADAGPTDPGPFLAGRVPPFTPPPPPAGRAWPGWAVPLVAGLGVVAAVGWGLGRVVRRLHPG